MKGASPFLFPYLLTLECICSAFLYSCFLHEGFFLHEYTSAWPLPSSHLIFSPTESPASVLQRANIASEEIAILKECQIFVENDQQRKIFTFSLSESNMGLWRNCVVKSSSASRPRVEKPVSSRS